MAKIKKPFKPMFPVTAGGTLPFLLPYKQCGNKKSGPCRCTCVCSPDEKHQSVGLAEVACKQFIGVVPSKKEYQIRLKFWELPKSWESKFIVVVCADFDLKQLPKGFSSFDALEQYLQMNYWKSFVMRSFSGGVKLFTLVLTDGTPMTVKTALATLERYLEPELFAAIDTNHSALNSSFISGDAILAFRGWLDRFNLSATKMKTAHTTSFGPYKKTLIDDEYYTHAVYDSYCGLDSPNGGKHASSTATLPNIHVIHLYQGEIPNVLRSAFRKFGNKFEVFVRYLLSPKAFGLDPKSRMNGMQIPTKCLIPHNIFASEMSRFIKRIIKIGWLECTNHSYMPGVKAKTYRATGGLLEALRQCQRGTSTSLIAFDPISVGFNEKLLETVRILNCEEDVLGWVRVVSRGVEHKLENRLGRARILWKSKMDRKAAA